MTNSIHYYLSKIFNIIDGVHKGASLITKQETCEKNMRICFNSTVVRVMWVWSILKNDVHVSAHKIKLEERVVL